MVVFLFSLVLGSEDTHIPTFWLILYVKIKSLYESLSKSFWSLLDGVWGILKSTSTPEVCKRMAFGARFRCAGLLCSATLEVLAEGPGDLDPALMAPLREPSGLYLGSVLRPPMGVCYKDQKS